MTRTDRSIVALPVAATLAACVLLAPSQAHASETFPDTIRNHWGVRTLPVAGSKGCRLCHANDSGGADNISTYFGIQIRDTYRVKQRRTDQLTNALDQIEARGSGSDADRDGASDYEEIVEDGTNPSDPRDRRPPDVVPGVGGAGGADGEGGAPALPELPPLPPLPELPPLLGHGCSVANGSTHAGWLSFGFALSFAAGWLRRVRRRARKLRQYD